MRRRRRKRNHFCFHKPHMSCTHSPRSQRPNVVVMQMNSAQSERSAVQMFAKINSLHCCYFIREGKKTGLSKKTGSNRTIVNLGSKTTNASVEGNNTAEVQRTSKQKQFDTFSRSSVTPVRTQTHQQFILKHISRSDKFISECKGPSQQSLKQLNTFI